MARKPCPHCGSKKWKKDSDGRLTCSDGHVMLEHRVETNEREYGTQGLRKRRIKSTRTRKEKKSRANPLLYHGARARFHYFQCLQVILRMQIQTLRELWSLPDEFEAICRDCWALHLSLLEVPPNPEPYLHAQDQRGYGAEDQLSSEDDEAQDDSEESQERDKSQSAGEANADNVQGAELRNPDSASEEENLKDELEITKGADNLTSRSFPEIVELLKQGSASEGEGEATDDDHDDGDGDDDSGREGRSRNRGSTASKPKSKKNKSWRRDDTPAGTVAVIVYACWTMRVPVIYQDFIRLIETYRLPYLDPVRLLSPSLTRHLTKHTKQALSPHFAPSPVFLHTLASRLARGASQKYGIFTPELNAAPVLWRAIRHMGGNATLYTLTKTLARFLELPLTLNPVFAPPGSALRNATHSEHGSQSRSASASEASRSRSRAGARDANDGQFSGSDGLSSGHMSDNVPPEVAFAATCVVALKLCYRLDDGAFDVQARGAWDPLCNMPSVNAYLTHLSTMQENKSPDMLKSRGNKASGTSETLPPGSWEDTDIDAYLEFCERALLGARRDEDEEAAVEIFPLRRRDDAEAGIAQGGGRSTRADSEAHENVLPAAGPGLDEVQTAGPGELHAVYSAQDVLGKLPDAYGLVLGRAAGWCGVGGDELGAVVERFERRLGRLYALQRRREREQ